MRRRVGVNLLWLMPGVVGGSEDAAVAALRALRAHDAPDLDLRLFALDPFAEAYPDLVEAWPTELLGFSGRPRPARIVAESTWLARRARALDVVHHWGGTVPVLRSAPSVLTVHDLQPLEHRFTHGAVKRAYLTATLPSSVRTARLVVTPSEYVRRSVIARTGADPGRVVVVPHTPALRPVPAPAADVAERYALDGPVVLYPAITYPHKNHLVLVEAFARVLEHHPDALLVLTGRPDAAEDSIRAEIERLGIGHRVRRPGRVPGGDLMAMFDAATLLAWPSWYEGFGVPVAEAMARGVPVVAARATALPEIVGDAGVLVDPHDAPGWAAEISRVLADAALRERLAEAGRRRAERWAPDTVARAFADVYRQAATV